MPVETRHDDYLISDDPTRLDAAVIHRYLSEESYWARQIPRETVDRSLQHSLGLGAYTLVGEQVGFARVVSDYATFAWLCDVFVLTPHRGHGLGKALIRAVLAHPRLQNLRRFALATRDAHGLYAQFGFTPMTMPQTQMERRNQDLYLRLAAQSSTPAIRPL